MSTIKLSELRRRGLIPAKQHDAFLLSLLLAVLANVIFFAVQALLPKIALLLALLGGTPVPRPPEPEKQMPFVLVDPSFLNEEVRDDLPADAVGTVGREARQTEETPDLPEGTAHVAEGVDVILAEPEGNPGPIVPPGNAELDVSQPEPPSPEQPPAEAIEAMQLLQAIPEQPPEPEQTPPEQPEQPTPENQPQETPSEPPPEPDVPEMPPEPAMDIVEQPVEPTPVEPPGEDLDLAALPISPEGFVDSSTRELERLAARESQPPRQPVRERAPERRDPAPVEQPPSRPQPPREAAEPQQARPPERARPQPVFKKIGGESNPTGSPPRRNTQTSVKLLGDDASMRILQHRWGPYMAKVARQLQESLNRQVILSPTTFQTGQVKIRFGIAPDGTLSHFETIFFQNGMEAERIMSERTLTEAAPFDPLTPEMQKDENFQNMTVTVYLM